MCFHPTAIQIHHQPEQLPSSLIQRTENTALQWRTHSTPLVLITAPPGYGKTTLIQQWQQHCHQHGKRTALLRLHKSANYLPTLLEAIGRLLHLTVTPHHLAELSDLIALGSTTTEVPQVIFIDNLEALNQRQSIAAIETLLRLAPTGVRFIVAGRYTRHLRLAQWRLNQQVSLVNESHLAVKSYEAPMLSTQCLQTLSHWPAAVFYHAQRQANQSTSSLESTLSLVHDYFDELLADMYSSTQQRLLMIGAIHPHFSAASLAFLSGHKTIDEEMVQWQRDNIFIRSHALPRASWEFMPLFRHYLQQRLAANAPCLSARLHKRAQRYLSEQTKAVTNTVTAVPNSTFTSQEQRVLQQITKGKSNKDIAAAMEISEGTVKWHLHNLYRKMHVSSRAQAILKATNVIHQGQPKLAL